MKRFILIIAALIVILIPHVTFSQDKYPDKIHLKANLEFLASDELGGREAGTHDEKVASLFIASRLEEYGILPFGDSSTYFQNFNLQLSSYSPNSLLTLINKNGTILDSASEWFAGKDFVSASRGFSDDYYLSQSTGIVFAGFGIKADEYNYNDYLDLNVKGKTVVVLSGEPYSKDTNYFAGAKRTKYSMLNMKAETAKQMGAAGILVLSNDMITKYWDFLSERTTSPNYKLLKDTETNELANGDIPAFIISNDFAWKLFDGETYMFNDIQQLEENHDKLPHFVLNKQLKYNLKINIDLVKARNVIGILPGIDPKLKTEYVVMSAHYDHLGTRRGVVYNGADDDGSGTVSVLESARLLAKIHSNKRSILFVFHTGEEKGLLGSEYLTSTVNFMDKIITDINLDMVGRGSGDSIYCIGSNKLSTEYYQFVKQTNEKTSQLFLNYKFDDPNDPERFYYRSDHYNYAKFNIPIVFFFDDMTVDYHKPTDDVDKINFDKIAEVVNLAYYLALDSSNRENKFVIDKTETLTR